MSWLSVTTPLLRNYDARARIFACRDDLQLFCADSRHGFERVGEREDNSCGVCNSSHTISRVKERFDADLGTVTNDKVATQGGSLERYLS